MSDSPAGKPVDYTNPFVIATGLIVFSIFLFAVPAFVFVLPFAIAFLVYLYRKYAANRNKARALARKHLGPSLKTTLDVELSPGLSESLMMNDWGVVFVKSRKKPVELAWNEIKMVDEAEIAVLSFYSYRALEFAADISQDRYFLATEAIQSKIPGRTSFHVDPLTGTSNLTQRLDNAPFTWGRFTVSSGGIEQKGVRARWDEVRSVQETVVELDDIGNIWNLTFLAAGGHSISLRSDSTDDGRTIGNTGYDLIKAMVANIIPDRASFVRPAGLARERAKEEFQRCRDTTKAAFSLARKSGKFDPLEQQCRHMLTLLDRFSLEDSVAADKFFRDYAELFRRTNRPDEAAKLEARIGRSRL